MAVSGGVTPQSHASFYLAPVRRSLFWLLSTSLFLCSLAHGSGIAGTDADHNGIRDDIDTYIAEQTPASSATRAAAQAYARAIQSLVTGVPPTAGAEAPLLALHHSGALGSGALGSEGQGNEVRGWAEWARELRARTVNTGARLNAYAAALDAAGPQFVPLQPDGEGECPAGNCTVVIFQNGILTSEETALKSVLALRRLLGETAANQRLLYALNYNPTEGMRDFVEVFRQKFGEQDTAAAFAGTFGEPGALSGVAASLLQARLKAAAEPPTTLAGWATALTQPGRLLSGAGALMPTPDEITGAVRQYAEVYLKQLVRATVQLRERLGTTTYMDDNARQLTDGVEVYLRRGLRVVLVAHSQGNLYADVVHRELARRGVSTARFAVVGVAVPNGQSPAGGPYVSTQADLVLGALRLVFPVLEANDRTVAAGQPGGASLGHAFVDVYTSPGSVVSGRVRDAVYHAIEQVARP